MPGSSEREWMICPSCHHPNDPDTKYCESCGAPLGPTAAWGPWEQTQAEGFAFRQATSTDRPKLILVLGTWLVFFPVGIASIVMLWVTVKDTDWRMGDRLTMVICLGLLALSSVLIYRSSANYWRHRPR